MPNFTLPVPRQWSKHIKSAFIHTISPASVVFTSTCALGSKRKTTITRLKAELAQAYQEIALLREKMAIRDERFRRIFDHKLDGIVHWPFSWWIAVVVDHFSRYAIGFAVFKKKPTSLEIRSFLGRTFQNARMVPRHIITDRDKIFDCDAFKKWCKRRKTRPRYGAVGKSGSIAIIERFFRSMKSEISRQILVPLRMDVMRREVSLYIVWYNEHRPHSALEGRTPTEVYRVLSPANSKPRFEPRSRWPRGSPCAAPQVKIKGKNGSRLVLVIGFFEGRKHLPVIKLKRVA